MKSVSGRLKSVEAPDRYHSAVRCTDYRPFRGFAPSSELLGYYQSSALRTGDRLQQSRRQTEHTSRPTYEVGLAVSSDLFQLSFF